MMKIADLIFTRSPNDPISLAIRFRTWSDWSHVMIATGVGKDVISADAEGVVCREMREDEFNHFEVLRHPEINEEQGKAILRFCFEQVGKGYDFLGLADFLINADVQSESRWFCAEVCFEAYRAAGIELLKRVDHAFVSPRDLFISPLLVEAI